MELKRFNRLNNIVATLVMVVASFTYLTTIEPTVSFWDCGEFIASSYKLEVGHPPGNPVFQVIARFFTIFGSKESAAVLVNIMSALCSAFTILLLYLTIVHLSRRIVEKASKALTTFDAVRIVGSGVVGALAYCWSDTFWFSAVEAEVYAMSSLVTALVLWAMLKWEERADEPYANRWLVFIAFMMGLSIGIHLLNLLTIPVLGLLYYFRKYKVTTAGAWKAFIISCILLAVLLWGVIPYIPLWAAHTDRLFVNGFGLPRNSGAALFSLLLIAGCFYGVYRSYKKGSALWNVIFLCSAVILIGYSVFAVVVIRSSVNTPTNEYQPDNPYTLVRYLNREQYGRAPLVYGQTFKSSLVDIKTPTYYNYMNGKYVKLEGPAEGVYAEKVLFPRMYAPGASGSSYEEFYQMYTNGLGTGPNNIPTFGANMRYFVNYQLNFMYWRYFLWNFAGRQNDIHASIPGDIYKGNWESGIGFIDRARLGDQSIGPDYVVNSRAKNHFYFLPLILGIIGLLYQLKRDKRNFLVTFLLFFLTGIAVVLYLNQPPYQPRERDYAYAGSFYVFTIWIGFAVLWLSEKMAKLFAKKSEKESDAQQEKRAAIPALIAFALCLLVPVQMVSQTWDDHDRSNRYTCHDMAYNYLIGLDSNAVLITHGDCDTFPLWYMQEVEGVRTDVRIMNTSLLGTDWYIDQMQAKQYDSEPVKFTLKKESYYYGKNDFIPVSELIKRPITAAEAVSILADPAIVVKLGDGKEHNVVASKTILLPVDKENVKKYGIVAPKDYDKILDTLVLEIPKSVSTMDKASMMILDMLSNYKWDRPIYILPRGGDINLGEKPYMQYDGFANKLVPIKSKTGVKAGNLEQVNTELLYDLVMNKFKLESYAEEFNVDYQNLMTFTSLLSIREFMVNTAKALVFNDEPEKAIEVLDKMERVFPQKNFPLNVSLLSSVNDVAVIDAISVYFACNENEKAIELGSRMVQECEQHIQLLSKPYKGEIFSWDNLQRNIYYMIMIADSYKAAGATAEAAALKEKVNSYLKSITGQSLPDSESEGDETEDSEEEVAA